MRSRAEKHNAGKFPSRPYTEEEDQMILEHSIPDRELSDKISRSVGAIQKRRYRLGGGRKLDKGEFVVSGKDYFTEDEMRIIRNLTLSVEATARILGRDKQSIYKKRCSMCLGEEKG